MKILDFLSKEAVLIDLQSTDKKGVLDELAWPLAGLTHVDHRDIVRVLIERERLGSTGIGKGIAIPHGKLSGLDALVLGFGLSRGGVNFDSIDGKLSHIFFLLLSPDNSTGLHLQLLARLSKLLKDDRFMENLRTAGSADDVIRTISGVDEEF